MKRSRRRMSLRRRVRFLNRSIRRGRRARRVKRALLSRGGVLF